MATIRENPKKKGHWNVRWTCPTTGKQYETFAGKRRDATRLIGKIEDAIRILRNGEGQIPAEVNAKEWFKSGGNLKPSVDYANLIDLFLTSKKESLSLRTHDTYKAHLKRLRACGSRVRLEAVLQTIRSDTSVENAEKYRKTYLTFWNWMRKRGYVIEVCPAESIELGKRREIRARKPYGVLSRELKEKGVEVGSVDWGEAMRDGVFLREEELRVRGYRGSTGRHAVNDNVFALACLLVAETGMRRSEVVRLRQQDVNTEKRIIHVRQRKGAGEFHYKTASRGISRSTAESLADWMLDVQVRYPLCPHGKFEAYEDDLESYQKENQKQAEWLSHLLESRRKHCPLAGAFYGWHVLRHSLNALAKAKGLSVDQTMKLLGHASKTMYHYYGGEDETELANTVDALFS